MKNFDKSKLLNKTNRELEVYINQPEKFESDAVESAAQILRERGVDVILKKETLNSRNIKRDSFIESIIPYKLLYSNVLWFIISIVVILVAEIKIGILEWFIYSFWLLLNFLIAYFCQKGTKWIKYIMLH